jgi:hypothetical protein
MTDFREHGFAAVLAKPFSRELLADTLRAIGVPPTAAAGSGPGPAGAGG